MPAASDRSEASALRNPSVRRVNDGTSDRTSDETSDGRRKQRRNENRRRSHTRSHTRSHMRHPTRSPKEGRTESRRRRRPCIRGLPRIRTRSRMDNRPNASPSATFGHSGRMKVTAIALQPIVRRRDLRRTAVVAVNGTADRADVEIVRLSRGETCDATRVEFCAYVGSSRNRLARLRSTRPTRQAAARGPLHQRHHRRRRRLLLKSPTPRAAVKGQMRQSRRFRRCRSGNSRRVAEG